MPLTRGHVALDLPELLRRGPLDAAHQPADRLIGVERADDLLGLGGGNSRRMSRSGRVTPSTPAEAAALRSGSCCCSSVPLRVGLAVLLLVAPVHLGDVEPRLDRVAARHGAGLRQGQRPVGQARRRVVEVGWGR